MKDFDEYWAKRRDPSASEAWEECQRHYESRIAELTKRDEINVANLKIVIARTMDLEKQLAEARNYIANLESMVRQNDNAYMKRIEELEKRVGHRAH